MMHRCGIQILGSVLLFLSTFAHAGLFDDDEARRAILDLRQKVDTNRQQVDEQLKGVGAKHEDDSAQFRRVLMDVQGQLEESKAESAKLRGENERLAKVIADFQKTFKDTSSALDERLRKFEPSKVSADGQTFFAEPGEVRDFEAGLAVFRKGDFAAATPLFVEFLKRYPTSGYLPSANFWLGNARYATKDFTNAVQNFRAVIAANPDHLRAADSLLSVANCQLELKDLRVARKTLEDLIRSYPQSEAASTARERLTKLK